MIPLAFASEESLVTIKAINAGKGVVYRLAELGLTIGSTVRVVKASGPGPVIIELCCNQGDGGSLNRCPSNCCASPSCRWRLALGFGVAMKIYVEGG